MVSDGQGGYVLQIRPNQPNGTAIIEKQIDAPVMNADVGDMNQDEHPEVLIFTQSVGSGFYGDVITYSLSNEDSCKKFLFLSYPKNSCKVIWDTMNSH